MTLNLDLAPTLLDLAGVAIPEMMQGRSLAALVQGRRVGDWRKSFFYEHHYGPKIIPPSEGIRTERWAYLRWLAPNPEGEELYDLLHDPLEQTNLAAAPSSLPILKALREEWQRSRAILE